MIDLVARHILPAALSLLPERMDTPEARILLLAIAGQESGYEHRRQVGGPALSLWQFERIGLTGVLMHPASTRHADAVCAALLYDTHQPDDVHRAMEHNDVLACALARLLLWTDPHPLPPIGEYDWAWDYYLRTWRPGKPHRERWANNYHRARAAYVRATA